MYIEIKTDDTGVILSALERQLAGGRDAQVSLRKEAWLFVMCLTTGETETDAVPVDEHQDLRAA